MARLVVKSKDKNRFTKKYPFVRAPKREVFETTGVIEIEVLTLRFNNSSQESAFYETAFDNDTGLRILVSPRDTTSQDSANVALSIDDNLSDTSKVTVNASARFTGDVDVVAIKVIE